MQRLRQFHQPAAVPEQSRLVEIRQQLRRARTSAQFADTPGVGGYHQLHAAVHTLPYLLRVAPYFIADNDIRTERPQRAHYPLRLAVAVQHVSILPHVQSRDTSVHSGELPAAVNDAHAVFLPKQPRQVAQYCGLTRKRLPGDYEGAQSVLERAVVQLPGAAAHFPGEAYIQRRHVAQENFPSCPAAVPQNPTRCPPGSVM